MTHNRTRFRLAAVVLLGGLLIFIAVGWSAVPVRDWTQSLVGTVRGLGLLGVGIYALAYIVLVVLLAPAGVMSIAAGLIYGAWAFPLVVVSATIGAALAFLLARYLARDTVGGLLERRRVLRVVDKAIEEEGWKIVALLRLNPIIPFVLQNYFFGATKIGFLPYLAATFFGIMPGAAAYIYIGALGDVAAGGGGALKTAVFARGFAATVVLVVIIARKAKAKLRSLGVDES